MPSCVFRKCTNYFSKVNKSHGLTYHSFPADGVELQEWIEIVRKQRCEADWIYSKQSKICSAHFGPEDFNKSGRRTLLRKGARPRLKEYEIRNSLPNSILPSELLNNVSIKGMEEHLEPPCKTALRAKVYELTKENDFLKAKNRSLTTKNERLVKKVAKTTSILKILKKRYSSTRKLLQVHLTRSSVDLNFNNDTSLGPEDSEIFDKVQGNILCRSCGNEVASSNDLISEFSPHSRYSFTDSIFDKDEVLVQVFVGNFIINYPVIVTHISNCVGIQEWVESGSWYPGYRWKPCVCPDCGEFIGWIFEPLDSDTHFVKTPHTLFGLLLPSLIGESCKYTYIGGFGFCQFPDCGSWRFVQLNMSTTTDTMSAENKEFLELCEEELKDRYTENDKEFMKVFKSEPSTPPIMETWWAPQNSGRRNDRRHNRRSHPYERNNREYDRGDRRDYSDYKQDNDRGQSYRNHRPRY